MLNKTVLLTSPIHPEAFSRIEAGAHILALYEAATDEILALLPKVHGIILGSVFSVGPAELELATELEVIGRHGVGMDNVDVAAASERRIPVTYVPYGPTESTAEHSLLLILAAARHLSLLDRSVRSGDFEIQAREEAMGRELEGMTLGVVGFGRIGQRLAEMCRNALHMQVRVFDPYLEAKSVTAWGAVYVNSLAEMAGQVDVLSIHVPLTPDTHHLIGRDAIRAMKRGAILVNASRGPVVDESSLIAALEDGHLGAAGIDVFDPEPPAPDNPLLAFDQVVLTPHVGSFTHEGRLRMGLTVVEDVLSALRGEEPQYLANPEVWPQRRALGA